AEGHGASSIAICRGVLARAPSAATRFLSAVVVTHAPSVVHARAVPSLRGARGAGKGATGTRAPRGRPGAGTTRPGRRWLRASLGTPSGSLGPLGSLGRHEAPACGDLCPGVALWCPARPVAQRCDHLEPARAVNAHPS